MTKLIFVEIQQNCSDSLQLFIEESCGSNEAAVEDSNIGEFVEKVVIEGIVGAIIGVLLRSIC